MNDKTTRHYNKKGLTFPEFAKGTEAIIGSKNVCKKRGGKQAVEKYTTP